MYDGRKEAVGRLEAMRRGREAEVRAVWAAYEGFWGRRLG